MLALKTIAFWGATLLCVHASGQTPQPPTPAALSPGPMRPGQVSPPVRQNGYRPALQPGQPAALPYTGPQPDHTVRSNYPEPFRVQKETGRITALETTLGDLYETDKQISYDLPARMSGTGHYRAAFTEIKAMLDGTKTCDLKRAVFLVENAWDDNRGSYAQFCARIDEMASAVRHLVSQGGGRDNKSLNMAVFGYLTDTTFIPGPAGTRPHLPLRYDFGDCMGREDWSKMFVTKLIRTGSGQCHSMPLLFLILAGEVGAGANLAFGPSHIYVKFPDRSGRLRNLELTNGRLTSDSWIVASGYVNTETIRHGIYLDTLSPPQAIALCMFDLAKGYAIRFGMDRFVLDAVNAGLGVHPASFYGLALKSDFYTLWCQYAVGQAGNPSLAEVRARHPRIKAIHDQMLRMYDLIDATGYQDMPEEQYVRWLASGNDPARIREDQTIRNQLSTEQSR